MGQTAVNANETEGGDATSSGAGNQSASSTVTGEGVTVSENNDLVSPTQGGGDGGSGGTGHPDVPPVLVVNCQLPNVPTPFSGPGDGPTVHVIFTFRATRRLCRYAARVWAEENDTTAADVVASGSSERTGAGDPAVVGAAAASAVKASPPGGPFPEGVAAGGAVGQHSAVGDGGAATSDGAGSGNSLPRGGSDKAMTGVGGQEPGNGGGGGGGVGEEGEGAGEEEVPESVRLLVEWARHAEDDGIVRGRFKAIGDIVNADEASLVFVRV